MLQGGIQPAVEPSKAIAVKDARVWPGPRQQRGHGHTRAHRPKRPPHRASMSAACAGARRCAAPQSAGSPTRPAPNEHCVIAIISWCVRISLGTSCSRLQGAHGHVLHATPCMACHPPFKVIRALGSRVVLYFFLLIQNYIATPTRYGLYVVVEIVDVV